MREIGVGLLGFGTVGAGVAEGLLKNREVIAQRLGADIVLKKIADLDTTTDRGITVPPGVLTTDALSVIHDPGIEVIVELIGGTGIAKTFVLEALKSGKNVVTANKKMLAEYGGEIFKTASENHVDIYFGASVGGGIPVIRVLREGLAGNPIPYPPTPTLTRARSLISSRSKFIQYERPLQLQRSFFIQDDTLHSSRAIQVTHLIHFA